MEKIEVLKRAKKSTFPFPGVSPWILSKYRGFSYRCFHRSYFRKDRFLKLWKEKNGFKGKKMKFQKRPKKWTFSKRVSPWILSKNRTFSYRRFSQNSYQERSFLILWKEKNDFKWKKLKFKQGPKNGHFLKGLVHGFCPKMELSLIAVFHRNYVRKDRFWIF